MTTPLLDRAAIEARIPHRGSMVLLDALLECDATRVRCRAGDHADPAHPLRRPHGLPAAAAVEYAAQAMALHGALNTPPGAPPPAAGFLAALRDVVLHVERLDTAPGPLVVEAALIAGDASQAIYRFALADAEGRALASGRATVVLRAADR